jgi:hypothetical protein
MHRFILVRAAVGILLICLIPTYAAAPPLPVIPEIREQLPPGVTEEGPYSPIGGEFLQVNPLSSREPRIDVLGQPIHQYPGSNWLRDLGGTEPITPSDLQDNNSTRSTQDLVSALALLPKSEVSEFGQADLNNLAEALRRIGVDNDGSQSSLADQLHEYQELVGLPIKNEIDGWLIERIDRDLQIAHKLTEHFPPPGEPPADCDVCGGFLSDSQANYSLVRHASGIGEELWTLEETSGPPPRPSRFKGDAIEQFHKIGRRIALENSREDFHVLYAAPNESSPDMIDVQYGRAERKWLLRADFVLLLQQLLVKDSAPITILSDGTTNDPDLQATRLAAALKGQIGGARDVFVARDPSTAYQHQLKLRDVSVKTGADITVYTSEMIRDYDAVEHIQKSLQRAGIRVYPEGAGLVPSSAENVIVVTGHRGPDMAAYLTRLKDAGVLRGKPVMILSCYDSGVELAQSTLTRGPNAAIGVFYFSEAINAAAVEAVMREFADAVGRGDVAGRLDHAFEHAAREALEKADPVDRLEIEKLLHGMTIQTSALDRSFASDSAA